MTSPDRETDSRRGSPFIPGAAGPPRRASFLTGDPGEPGSLVSNVASSSSSSSYFPPRNLRSRRRGGGEGGDGSDDLISLSSGLERIGFVSSLAALCRSICGEGGGEKICVQAEILQLGLISGRVYIGGLVLRLSLSLSL